jgi:hypothetical protein
VESFLELKLSDDDKRKILWDNCARFYARAETADSAQAKNHSQTIHP